MCFVNRAISSYFFFLLISGVHLVTRATLSFLMENVFLTVSTHKMLLPSPSEAKPGFSYLS